MNKFQPTPLTKTLENSPYPGLRPFGRTEADVFFGREEQVKGLDKKLHATRFTAVVGSSGCGKSSLVQAGLLPHLERKCERLGQLGDCDRCAVGLAVRQIIRRTQLQLVGARPHGDALDGGVEGDRRRYQRPVQREGIDEGLHEAHANV